MYEYITNHIPISRNRRPGIVTQMESITIHNTANPKSSAKNERDWLINTHNERTASWHIVVDDKQVIEAIPLNEVAWHAGTEQGNYSSIGIEICESGDQSQVWKNAIALIASMLHKRGWNTKKVKTHQYWSGKNCPRLLLPRWEEFIKGIDNKLEELNNNINQLHWKQEGIEYLAKEGLLKNQDDWLKKIDDPMPVWAVMLLLKRIHLQINELNK